MKPQPMSDDEIDAIIYASRQADEGPSALACGLPIRVVPARKCPLRRAAIRSREGECQAFREKHVAPETLNLT